MRELSLSTVCDKGAYTVRMHVQLTFGEWLDDELNRRRIGRRDLARELEVDVSAIGLWIRGETRPLARHCDAIAQVLGVPPNEVRRRAGRKLLVESEAPIPTCGPSTLPNEVDGPLHRLIEKLGDLDEKELSLVDALVDQIRRNRQEAGSGAGLGAGVMMSAQ